MFLFESKKREARKKRKDLERAKKAIRIMHANNKKMYNAIKYERKLNEIKKRLNCEY